MRALRAPSIEAVAVTRGERAVAVQEQGRDAHELLDLDERGLVLLVAVVLCSGAGQAGEVGQCLRALPREPRFAARGEPERADEAPAPVEQRAAALGQRCTLVRDQQFQAEV